VESKAPGFLEILERVWDDLADYQVVLEILNGAWTLLCIMVIAALSFYIYARVRLDRPCEPYWVEVQPTVWYHETGTQLAIGLLFSSIGTMVTRGWAWGYRECVNRLGNPLANCTYITDDVLWLFLGGGCGLFGGVFVIRTLLPHTLGACRYVVPVVLSLVPPIVWHVWGNWPPDDAVGAKWPPFFRPFF